MKKTLVIITFISMIFIIFSCTMKGVDPQGYNSYDSIGSPEKLKTSNQKSLYLSNITNSMNNNISDLDITSLCYINSSNKNVPLTFLTSSNKTVVINIKELKKLSSKIIVFSFDFIFEVEFSEDDSILIKQQKCVYGGSALIDVSSGKVYDLTGYDITDSIIYDDNLYIIKSEVIYKIGLDEISNAIPLNNNNFDPARRLQFGINNKIIGGTRSYDINSIITPKNISQTSNIHDGDGRSFQINNANTGTIFDNNGDLYGYRLGGYSDNPKTKIWTYRMSIDDAGQTIVSNLCEIPLTSQSTNLDRFGKIYLDGNKYYSDELIIGSNAFIKITRNTTSGISIESRAIDFPDTRPNNYRFHDMKIYWISNKKIMSLDLDTNISSELYANNDIIDSSIEISNDKIIFYQYITVTNIGTYSLTIGENTPILIDNNKIEVESIVELDF